MSQGYKHLSTFDAAHLGVFFSFRAGRNAARDLVSFLSTEKGASYSFKDLCLVHHGLYLVGSNWAGWKSSFWATVTALLVQ